MAAKKKKTTAAVRPETQDSRAYINADQGKTAAAAKPVSAKTGAAYTNALNAVKARAASNAAVNNTARPANGVYNLAAQTAAQSMADNGRLSGVSNMVYQTSPGQKQAGVSNMIYQTSPGQKQAGYTNLSAVAPGISWNAGNVASPNITWNEGAAGGAAPQYDFNGDGQLDMADGRQWLRWKDGIDPLPEGMDPAILGLDPNGLAGYIGDVSNIDGSGMTKGSEVYTKLGAAQKKGATKGGKADAALEGNLNAGKDKIAAADAIKLPGPYTSPYDTLTDAQLGKLLSGKNPYMDDYKNIGDIAYDGAKEGMLDAALQNILSPNEWKDYLKGLKKPEDFVDKYGDQIRGVLGKIGEGWNYTDQYADQKKGILGQIGAGWNYDDKYGDMYASALQKVLNPGERPEYEDKWGNKILDTTSAIENYGDFNYNINEDELYKNYADQYTRQAKLAAEDAMGKGMAASGGYGNSYAQSGAQQGYNQTMQGLTDIMPQLEERAYNRWKDSKNDLRQNLNMYMGLDRQDWDKYRDVVSDYEFDVRNAYDQLGAVGDARDFDYGMFKDQRSDLYDQFNTFDQASRFDLDAYKMGRDDLYNQYNTLADASNTDYDRWHDQLDQYNKDRAFGAERMDAENNFRINTANTMQSAVNSDRDYNIQQNQLQNQKRSQALQAAGIYDDEQQAAFNALMDADANARQTQQQNFNQTFDTKQQLLDQGNTEADRGIRSQELLDNRAKTEFDQALDLASLGDFSALEAATGLDMSDAKTRFQVQDAISIYEATGDLSGLKALGIDTSRIETERAQADADWAAQYQDYSWAANQGIDTSAIETLKQYGIDEAKLNNIAKKSNISATEAATAIDLAAAGDFEGAKMHGLSDEACDYIRQQNELSTISQALSNTAAELGIEASKFEIITNLLNQGMPDAAKKVAEAQGIELSDSDLAYINYLKQLELQIKSNSANGITGGSGGSGGGGGGRRSSGGGNPSDSGYTPTGGEQPVTESPAGAYDAANVSAAMQEIDAWIDNSSGTLSLSDIEAKCRSMGLSAAEIAEVVNRFPDTITGGKRGTGAPYTGVSRATR